jgi:hypothetical protein
MRLKTMTMAVAIVAACAGLVVAQAPRNYRARLSTVPIDTRMLETVAGTGSVTATLTGSTLAINGTYEGLRTPATVARLHRGPKGIRGPSMFDLKVSGGTSGTITGSITLDAGQVDDLRRERFYVQLHSEKAPEGNLWGWLLPQQTPSK